MLALSNTASWESLQGTNPSVGSELLLQNAEDLGQYLASTLAENSTQVVISQDNIGIKYRFINILGNYTYVLLVLRAGNIVVQDDTIFPNLTFPDARDVANFTTTSDSTPNIVIPNDLLQRRSIGS